MIKTPKMINAVAIIKSKVIISSSNNHPKKTAIIVLT